MADTVVGGTVGGMVHTVATAVAGMVAGMDTTHGLALPSVSAWARWAVRCCIAGRRSTMHRHRVITRRPDTTRDERRLVHMAVFRRVGSGSSSYRFDRRYDGTDHAL